MITEISLDYFNCVQNMFLQINEFDNSITIIKHQVEEKKSSDGVFHSKGFKITKNNWKNDKKNGSWLGSGKGWSSSLNQNSNAVAGSKPKLEFRVHVKPKQLRGIEILWLCFQKSPQRDLDLLTQVVNFLSVVYNSVSMVLENERREIYEDFVNESLRRVN